MRIATTFVLFLSLAITANAQMSIRDFDSIKLYTRKNKSGVTVQVTNYGAIITSIVVPDRNGKMADVALGYDTIEEYINAVDKGIQEQMENGVIAGYPVVDVKVTLYDGSYHDVDSSEMAFKIAGSMGFKDGAARAKPVLLEPIMKVEVVTPEEYMGDVMGDLNRRRGLPQGMDESPSGKVIRAEVPLAEMFGYATDLRSMSQGRAVYTMEFQKYNEVPSNVADPIINR